jgi:hypothetical protein
VTRNRRSGESPYVHEDSIDPHLGIIRVDDMAGKPIATLWNFAMCVCVWPRAQHMADWGGGHAGTAHATGRRTCT